MDDDGGDPATVPGVVDHRRRVSERASVRRALAGERE